MKHNFRNRKFNDLAVIGDARRVNKSKVRFWSCKCLRPIHGEVVVTRNANAQELLTGKVYACVTCMKSDRKGKPRMKGGKIDQVPVEQAKIAASRGCAHFKCSGGFHNVACEQLNLFKPYSQRDVGDGVNLR